jgi:hypothetical protein
MGVHSLLKKTQRAREPVVKRFGEPDAEKPNVRLDDRTEETESWNDTSYGD